MCTELFDTRAHGRGERDDDVAVMARRSERELRTFLFGMATIDASRSDPTSVDLGAKLRRAAARVDDLYGSSVQVVVAPDLLPIPAIAADALASAAAEAIMNAAKHANAATIHVYAEPEDGGTTCSVRDDGVGFDPGRPATGQGLRSSIRERKAVMLAVRRRSNSCDFTPNS